MHSTATLLAILMLGGNPPSSPQQSAGGDSVRVHYRLLTMKGLDWRGPVHGQLAPAARQGTSTVWTAPGDVVSRPDGTYLMAGRGRDGRLWVTSGGPTDFSSRPLYVVVR